MLYMRCRAACESSGVSGCRGALSLGRPHLACPPSSCHPATLPPELCSGLPSPHGPVLLPFGSVFSLKVWVHLAPCKQENACILDFIRSRYCYLLHITKQILYFSSCTGKVLERLLCWHAGDVPAAARAHVGGCGRAC